MNRLKPRDEQNALIRAQYQAAVESWKAMGCVEAVELLTSSDPSCPACSALDRKRWKLGEQPALPIENCTEPGGCCRGYIAYTKEDPETAPFL